MKWIIVKTPIYPSKCEPNNRGTFWSLILKPLHQVILSFSMHISFELNLNTSNLKQLIRGIAPPNPYHHETFYDKNLNFSNKGLNMRIILNTKELQTKLRV